MGFDARAALDFYIRDGKEKEQFQNHDKRKIALLPYNTDQSDKLDPLLREDFISFDGFFGDCLRTLNNKANKIVDQVETLEKEDTDKQSAKKKKDNKLAKDKKALKAKIIENALLATNASGAQSDKLKAVLESIFFAKDNLLKYGPKAQLYLFRNSEESSEEISNFLLSIFLDDEGLKDQLRANIENKKHLLHLLMDESLPELADQKGGRKKRKYHKLDQEVVDLFKKDFSFLNQDKDAFLNDSSLLFKYYYFFYVSRASLMLSGMFKKKSFTLYFTLDNEAISESRRTYDVGWKTLESRLNNLFSHTVCLDLLNHIPIIESNGPLDYLGIKALYASLDSDHQNELKADVESIIELYCGHPASDANFDHLEEFISYISMRFQPEDDFERTVLKLYGAIDYQFEKFQRKGKRDGYGKWFSNFCKVSILKKRGKYGYTLSLSNEMLLFLTKLCIGDDERIKLKDLWSAFRARGIYFDDPTQQAIMAVYDKINLIEKKSDSGDAQYIRRIL